MGAMVIMKYLERDTVPAAALLAPVPPHGLFPSSLMLALGRPGLFSELNSLMSSGKASVDAMQGALFAGPLPVEQLLDYYGRFQRESQRAIWDMTLFNLPLAWLMNRPPLIALLAERDALFPLEQSRSGFTAIGMRTEVLADMGHAVMLERGWQRAADRIIGWLGEQSLWQRSGLTPPGSAPGRGRCRNRMISSVRSCGSKGLCWLPTTRFIHCMFCSMRSTTAGHCCAVWRCGSGNTWHCLQASRND
jgi:hypothetical protein